MKYIVKKDTIRADAEVDTYVEVEDASNNNACILVSIPLSDAANRADVERELAYKVARGLNAWAIYSKEDWDRLTELRNQALADRMEDLQAAVKAAKRSGFFTGAWWTLILVSIALLFI